MEKGSKKHQQVRAVLRRSLLSAGMIHPWRARCCFSATAIFSSIAEQDLRAPRSLRSLFFTAQYKIDPNKSPHKLIESTPCESSVPWIHSMLIAGVNCHVLITRKCHPDTVLCRGPFLNPQQQNHRNSLCWFKGEALQHAPNLKLAHGTPKSHRAAATWPPVWNEVLLITLLMQLCTEGQCKGPVAWPSLRTEFPRPRKRQRHYQQGNRLQLWFRYLQIHLYCREGRLQSQVL